MIHGVENYCDYRLACSEKAGKLLYPHKDFTVLKNAIDLEQYAYRMEVAREVRDEFNLGDALVLGAVGTIKLVKNPHGIVEILKAVTQIKSNTRLLWIGTDGGMKTEVEEKLRDLSLSDHVIFTGVRSDVNRLLQAMDVFLMPSFSEGIPVALIEAQATGLPCFVSDSVSKEADITDNCCYMPLGNYDKWAQRIMESNLTRKDNYRNMIDAGYDIHTTATWIQKLYLSI